MYRGSRANFLALFGLIFSAKAQNVCSLNAEGKPAITWQTCTSSGCTTNNAQLVIDANWRWTHSTSSATNCYTGNTWNAALCPNNVDCATNCCLDGSGGYQSTYGVSTSGSAATLNFVTNGPYATNIGSRLYLMGANNKYEMFNLLGKEFTFDVDASTLGCGLNGALYFVSMDADGGMAKYPTNKAGAQYGTGYCDTQCAMDLKWINGQANVEGWVPSTNDKNSGVGGRGSCCNEIDIFEANKISNAYTLHPCDDTAQHMCSGTNCSGTYAANRYGGDCDPDGCDLNPYRNGATDFYGPGLIVDTNKPVTVVTQFLTDASGKLNDVVRYYVQNGVLIATPKATNIPGFTGNSMNEQYCPLELSTFGETNYFGQHGGFAKIQSGMEAGMVLVLSLWDDHYANMLWLDSTYPVGSTAPGSARGSCSTSSGVPADVESQMPNSKVIYSNIKFGAINSTFTYTSVYGGGSTGSTSTKLSTSSTSSTSTKASTSTTLTTLTTSKISTTTSSSSSSSSTVASSTTSASGPTQTHWGQCGGLTYTGPTVCASPWTCQKQNDWYYQCL